MKQNQLKPWSHCLPTILPLPTRMTAPVYPHDSPRPTILLPLSTHMNAPAQPQVTSYWPCILPFWAAAPEGPMSPGLSLVIFLTEHSGLSPHNFKEPGRKTESPVKHAQNRAEVANSWAGATLQYSTEKPQRNLAITE